MQQFCPHIRPLSPEARTTESRMFPILLANIVSRALTSPSGRRRAPLPGQGQNGKPINLALQGGGAHGAFTWGVLDQLLEDGRTEIEGISGASARAMHAVML